MTDRIDLDDLDVSADDEPEPNRGDWFWKGEGEPEAEPTAESGAEETDAAATARTDAPSEPDTPDEPDAGDRETSGSATPRVPRADDDKPVGVPMDAGGGGGVAAQNRGDDSGEAPYGDPYGGTTADMTLAFTYEAVQRLEMLHAALADAETWTDYVGLVGEVPAHVLNKFQRDERLDLDFFNGGGMGPAERLAEVDSHSMFYADRMVVVGVDGESWIAEEAGWEFVDVADAAAKADWPLVDE
ncbi:hypothetical protein SAMN04487948_104131 [Halogranum amylolyticum]|uniref:DUF7124 domain-containing protein n=1 Tax=Halogranum amylolyticum TaxID=660520 RepID=A0A1H8RNP6_9EURY|nr:hypothetical protein [Halogranum amylolyticum]SEO67794.1 hypothetical protein SAMN04487948_104131 [Halogranum amylolyticum]